MKKNLLSVLLFLISKTFAFEKLPNDYLVSYGSQEAPLQIVQYYSFTCPHCIALFRKQFQQIKKEFIDSSKVSWVFHPVPMDLLTVQAMDCLKKLPARERKIFLEAILEEVFIDNPKFSATLLQKGIEVLGMPIPQLQEQSYLTETEAFQDAFLFLKQAEILDAVPAIEVNGIFMPAQIPDIEFIKKLLFEVEKQ